MDTDVINKALPLFKVQIGQQVREQREALEEQGIFPPGMFVSMFAMVGIAMSADDLALLESGNGPDLDARVLLALAFLFEVSTDKALVGALQEVSKQGA